MHNLEDVNKIYINATRVSHKQDQLTEAIMAAKTKNTQYKVQRRGKMVEKGLAYFCSGENKTEAKVQSTDTFPNRAKTLAHQFLA